MYDDENKTCLRILALGIYDLILFQLVEEMIDFEVINVFNNMVALKINPQVITLMKTFSSSNHYKKSRKWSFEMLLIMVVYQDNKPYDKKRKISSLFGTPWHLYLNLVKFVEHLLEELRRIMWELMILSMSKSPFH